ncbi:Hsp20/alpha crystallin family protein [Natronobacterium gregoryi]|uniref:Heat shock protein Hsp20 n=2 Tax=Natronobacterium gregoryi TaxID=44930 RepID=L0AKB4_NATGS|nr:Hsp20/alpha crystallin family protein [Natronobacterium gregoryi]AFZ74338.1 molecular chaperone (small heat shock protein) [Natronobacterium gregoryi SP2]ELY63434.1 heat shock protein Hsp20 [Natronobacterium gregoryi SP2]PLK22152.1 Hsp20/alpha crystallin family protein [Natronobacterium gregoryi SP2]SFI54007.1 Hsp20/alpha crystallin family protein [Natronobacterium gregoryi]
MSALRDALRDLSDDVFFDLLESDEAYLLVVDVPGVTADSIDLTIEDGTLYVDAQREKELPADYQYLSENRSLFFDVSLPVPDDAVASNAETTVDRGVLELTLPKQAPDGKTTIEVVDNEERGPGDGESTDDEPR